MRREIVDEDAMNMHNGSVICRVKKIGTEWYLEERRFVSSRVVS